LRGIEYFERHQVTTIIVVEDDARLVLVALRYGALSFRITDSVSVLES